MTAVCLKVQNLTKRFGAHDAVRNLSFSLHGGDILGFIGPNGAGKTTTISMILGLMEPTAGSIEIFGMPFPKYRTETLRSVGFAAPYVTLPGNLTVRQNLLVFAYLYSIPHPRVRVEEVLAELNLQAFANVKTGKLSSGEQARANLAKALLNSPRLLLFDEPTASLDPSTATGIRSQIQSYVARTRAGVVWASHNMHEVEQLCNRVVFLSSGHVVLDGAPNELIRQLGTSSLEGLFVRIVQASVPR